LLPHHAHAPARLVIAGIDETALLRKNLVRVQISLGHCAHVRKSRLAGIAHGGAEIAERPERSA